MELPKLFSNWIEVAKKCTELQAKHPDAIEIKFHDGDYVSEELNINAIKAKAFDEIMSNFNFTSNEVYSLKSQGIDNVNPGIFDFLMNLTH